MAFDSLAEAIENRDAARAAEILAAEPALRAQLNDPIPGGAFGATVLHVAVSNTDRAMIDALLNAGADINQKSHWWAGGFHVLETADPDLVAFLLERGAGMNVQAAAHHGRLDDVQRILQADPAAATSRGGDGQTALHRSATVDIARTLLDHGAEIDALDVDHESTPAQYLVRDHPDVVRYLMSRGARADILMASAVGDLAGVQDIVRANPESVRTTVSPADFPMRNSNAGGTIYIWTLGASKGPHAIARELGHEDVLRFLMDHTPDTLALAVACELGDARRMGELLAAHPGIVARLSDDERRRLPGAAQNDNTQGVLLMLDAGWPADMPLSDGATALHWAAYNGNAEMVKALLRRGAPVNTTETRFGGTPLGWCRHGAQHGSKNSKADHASVQVALAEAGAIGEN